MIESVHVNKILLKSDQSTKVEYPLTLSIIVNKINTMFII